MAQLPENWSMQFDKKYTTNYTLTHEFGHFIEFQLIDECNKQHFAEFTNNKTRALNSDSLSKSRGILKNWNLKIENDIAKKITLNLSFLII